MNNFSHIFSKQLKLVDLENIKKQLLLKTNQEHQQLFEEIKSPFQLSIMQVLIMDESQQIVQLFHINQIFRYHFIESLLSQDAVQYFNSMQYQVTNAIMEQYQDFAQTDKDMQLLLLLSLSYQLKTLQSPQLVRSFTRVLSQSQLEFNDLNYFYEQFLIYTVIQSQDEQVYLFNLIKPSILKPFLLPSLFTSIMNYIAGVFFFGVISVKFDFVIGQIDLQKQQILTLKRKIAENALITVNELNTLKQNDLRELIQFSVAKKNTNSFKLLLRFEAEFAISQLNRENATFILNCILDANFNQQVYKKLIHHSTDFKEEIKKLITEELTLLDLLLYDIENQPESQLNALKSKQPINQSISTMYKFKVAQTGSREIFTVEELAYLSYDELIILMADALTASDINQFDLIYAQTLKINEIQINVENNDEIQLFSLLSQDTKYNYIKNNYKTQNINKLVDSQIITQLENENDATIQKEIEQSITQNTMVKE
ncbi:Hypothetical_protein [Hexamita inflata]|uniref:Hypothetical_protein n=1 Tax=Hexamita inflata TaxID=28002 RepID=A0AA86PPQ3_9EUKA|nr:Hypothetical protein HINF_LOCUS28778 [Hexamita inflata]